MNTLFFGLVLAVGYGVACGLFVYVRGGHGSSGSDIMAVLGFEGQELPARRET
jgi:hypothetical protein